MKLVIMLCNEQCQVRAMSYDIETHEVEINHDMIKDKLGLRGFLEALSRMLLWTMEKIRSDAKAKAEETVNESE